jgi:(+)-trans-carveol dehydrogenase
MGRVEGKVAFITGAGRGQGRAHALRLAEEGADIIAVDVCRQLETVPYAMSTPEDLAETAKLVEDLDRRIVVREADVRESSQLADVVREGVAELGRLDIVVANAGIVSIGPAIELEEASWQEMLDVNLTGVWKTVKATVPSIIEGGRGGSVILTSSAAGLRGFPNISHYVAAKHGVVGLMRALAQELAPHMIRVNTVNPTTVDTPMVMNDMFYGLVRPDLEQPGRDEVAEAFVGLNALPIPWVEAIDISNAVLWLASDEARFVTGVAMPIDAGFCEKIGATPLVLTDAGGPA